MVNGSEAELRMAIDNFVGRFEISNSCVADSIVPLERIAGRMMK